MAAVRRRHKPRVEIAYDAIGCHYLGRPRDSDAFTIWHLHEHIDANLAVSTSSRKSHQFVRRHAADADLVVVPDAGRAEALLEAGFVPERPAVVMNCPRRQEVLPADRLRPALRERGSSGKVVVLYQGSIGEIQCADVVVRSMSMWPHEATLVFLGPVHREWRDRIERLARDQGDGVVQRLVMLPRVGYRDLLGYTVGADLGLGLIRQRGEHFGYCSGASNKRFEYMACGVAQVANRGHGMQELIEDTGCGACVDEESPEAVGRTVSRLIGEADARAEMGRKARKAHLEKYNYEVQFEPVRRRILEVLAGQGIERPAREGSRR